MSTLLQGCLARTWRKALNIDRSEAEIFINSQPMGNIANHRQPQNKAPSVKLENYTGNTCLETFLAKFQNMSKYYCWYEADRLFYLRAHLDGAAGQLLWSRSERDTSDDVVKLLRTRFGSENQAERFRTELQVRKGRKGESLQSLYQDVSRLMVLAYRRIANEMCDIVARDAFLAALDDRQLHVRILEKEPKTLDEALQIAIRLAAFDRVEDQPATDDCGRRSGRNTRSVKTTNSSNGCSVESPVTKTEVEMLRDAVHQLQIENQSLRDTAAQLSTAKQFQNPETVNSSSRRGNYRGDRRGRSGDCRKCGERSHWARDCDFGSNATARPRVVVVGTKRRPSEVYLKIRIAGRERCALFDTGYDHSCIASKFFMSAKTEPTTEKLYAANGTEIPVQGVLKMNFKIGSYPAKANLLVSHKLDEMILGVD